MKHFLDIHELEQAQLENILSASSERKKVRAGHPKGECDPDRPLAGRLLAMIFEKPSTRTRVSFDVAMRQLGGQTLVLSAKELQLGRGETIADTARVLSRMVDVIMLRTFEHEKLLELAEYATVPVINGLTDFSHPCQIMADLMTYREHRGSLRDRIFAWSGDSANVTNSWIHAAAMFGFEFRVAGPEPLHPDPDIIEWAKEMGARVTVSEDPQVAAQDADCVITDTWVSMNQTDAGDRHNLLKPYQVNEELMARAKPDAVFMHCLPAHRGEEVTAGVIDGPQSIVFDETENRLHAQKGILNWCFEEA